MMGKEFWKSACPHDCPSACSLEVERLSSTRIGRIRGAAANSYTDGVVCAKVARYAERVHHPDRLKQPLQRIGAKGSGQFRPISVGRRARRGRRGLAARDAPPWAPRRYGPTIPAARWASCSAGASTGCAMPWAIRGRRPRSASRRPNRAGAPASASCSAPIRARWRSPISSSCGAAIRSRPRSMSMTHVAKARKKRGAKLAVIDVYRTPTVEAADIGLVLRPGTDGALALAMMNVLLKEGLADRAYLARHTDFGADIEAHLADKTPEWARPSPGSAVDEIVDFARLYGRTAAQLPAAGLRLHALAQRRGRDARRLLPAGDHRRLAAQGGGAFFLRSRQLGPRYHAGARPRPDRSRHAHHRPVAHRPGAVRRAGRAGRRPAGHGDADAERQLGQRRARQRCGGARAGARGPVPLRARAVHDGDGAVTPTSCCRRRCSSNTTTSTTASATPISRSGRRCSTATRTAAPTTSWSARWASGSGADRRAST